jgi:hypothetical protein
MGLRLGAGVLTQAHRRLGGRALVDDFRTHFPDLFAYKKNSAIRLEPLPKVPLSPGLRMALTTGAVPRSQYQPRCE